MEHYFAFPKPQVLLECKEIKGVNQIKLDRVHKICERCLDGELTREHLLSLAPSAAIEYLTTLDGVGPFFANGILYRGAGIVDDITDDVMTKEAVKQAYSLSKEPSQTELYEIAENWKPYRMWSLVLIHIWLRREVGLPKKTFKRK